MAGPAPYLEVSLKALTCVHEQHYYRIRTNVPSFSFCQNLSLWKDFQFLMDCKPAGPDCQKSCLSYVSLILQFDAVLDTVHGPLGAMPLNPS